jgi:hypothetical protein
MSMQCTFDAGKKKRNELRLPTLRFVVADNWIDTLGMDAFRAWLKFHTWVDRTDSNREEDKIPYTIESVCKHLGIGKKKFYEKVMRPLWNHGLIDTVEYKEYKQKGKKPVNIVVYESPFNKHETEVLDLEKVRDYDTEYDSVSQAHGRKGGRPKKKITKLIRKGFRMETSKVSKWKPSKVSKQKPNNEDLNNLPNYSNKESNVLNKQQQQENKNHVVVVQEKYESLFQKKLTKKQAEDLITLADKHQVDLIKKMQNTYDIHRMEPRKRIVGAIKWAIENGDWEITSSTVSNPKPLPKAVAEQLKGKRGQQELTREQLEAKKLEIQRKIAMLEGDIVEAF